MLATQIHLIQAIQVDPGAPSSHEFYVNASSEPLAAQIRPEKVVKSIDVGDAWVKLVSLKGAVRYTPVANVKSVTPLETDKRAAPKEPRPAA